MNHRSVAPGDVQLICSKAGQLEEEAAVALYDAILINLSNLAAGETSGHALALSKAMYQTVVEHSGERPGFDAACSVICG